jgi:hypothetical protein
MELEAIVKEGRDGLAIKAGKLNEADTITFEVWGADLNALKQLGEKRLRITIEVEG